MSILRYSYDSSTIFKPHDEWVLWQKVHTAFYQKRNLDINFSWAVYFEDQIFATQKLKHVILLQKCRGSPFRKNSSCTFTWWVWLWQQPCYLQYGSMHTWKWHHWCRSHQVTPQLLAILLEVPIHSLCQVSGHHAPGNTSIVSGALFLYLYWWKFRFWDACMRLNMCSTTAHRLGCTSWDIWQVFCKFHHAFLFDFLHFLDLDHVNLVKACQLD